MVYDIIIVGAGTAGLSAAIYGCRAGHSVLIIERSMQGGQIVNSPEIENYPGLPKVSGFDFVQALYGQAVSFGAKVVYAALTGAELEGRVKTIHTDGGDYQGKTVILANGAKHRKLGCQGEEQFEGRGVSYCALCDGSFFRGRDVLVVGGGDTALQDVLFLSNICRKVYLVHRRDEFRAAHITISSACARGNVEMLLESAVERISGDDKVTSVTVKNLKTGETKEIALSGVFVAVGMEPENGMFSPPVALDQSGYLLAGEDCRTNVEGVYAAGDTRTKDVRQLITAAADGGVSATHASEYLSRLE